MLMIGNKCFLLITTKKIRIFPKFNAKVYRGVYRVSHNTWIIKMFAESRRQENNAFYLAATF
jgi:hypothetical protein